MSYIYFVQMDIPASLDAELNRIYDTEHVPMLSKVPGVDRVTRYRLEQSNDSRMQKYLAVYDIEAPAVVDSKAWDEGSAWGDWASKIRPHTTSRHHSFFEKIGEFGPGRTTTPYIYIVQMGHPGGARGQESSNRVYDAEHAAPLVEGSAARAPVIGWRKSKQ